MVWIVNASGDREPFDAAKVFRTCMRAGAEREIAEKIAAEATSGVRDGMSTKHILKITLRLLERFEEPHVVAKYDLKGAIMRLGPAGFPFETFLGEVLEDYGYNVKLRQIVHGACITHEVDIIATDKATGKTAMVECKYRNASGDYVGVKEALYTYARFLDLKEGNAAGKCEKFDEVWLATNSKFSTDVMAYAECKGMRLLGWRYPKIGSIEAMTEAKKLYPITILRALDSQTQKRLSAANLILCKDLLTRSEQDLKNATGLSSRQLGQLIEEAQSILQL